MRRGCRDRVEQHRAVGRVKEVDPTDADGADRVAVVARRQVQESCLVRFWLRTLLPVLKRYFECDLHRCRPAVRVEDVVEAGWRDVHEALSELDGGNVRRAQ